MVAKIKEKIVTDIQEKFKAVGNVVVTQYKGLNVAEISELRAQLRSAKAEYKVLKNSLTKIALKNLGYEDLAKRIDGPIGVVFEKGDTAQICRLLVKFSKDHDKFKVTSGLLNGAVLDVKQIQTIANLPSRQVLLYKLVSAIAGPLQNLVNVLNAPVQGLANALDQMAKQKK
jgi:large subunit ribosomal protein L10